MNWKTNLDELINFEIASKKRGIYIIVAGFIVLTIIGSLGLFIENKIVMGYILVCGMGSIFPLGALISKLAGVELFAKSPFGVLGALIAFSQALFIPAYIPLFGKNISWLPVLVGVIAGAHFIAYSWIYRSKAYMFMTIATVLVSYAMGIFFKDNTFVAVPYGIALVYLISIAWLKKENNEFEKQYQQVKSFS